MKGDYGEEVCVGYEWLAGLLEGEGCFSITPAQDNRRSWVRVSMVSTDEDVIDRVIEITGVGTKNIEKRDEKNPRHQRLYKWAIAQRDDTLKLLQEIRPYMLSRRQAKIDQCIRIIQESIAARDLPIGVYAHGNKYVSRISIGNKKRLLGSFVTPEEAKNAYENARKGVTCHINAVKN